MFNVICNKMCRNNLFPIVGLGGTIIFGNFFFVDVVFTVIFFLCRAGVCIIITMVDTCHCYLFKITKKKISQNLKKYSSLIYSNVNNN